LVLVLRVLKNFIPVSRKLPKRDISANVYGHFDFPTGGGGAVIAEGRPLTERKEDLWSETAKGVLREISKWPEC